MPEPDVAPRRAQRPDRPAKGDLRERALLDAAEQRLAGGTFAAASVGQLAQAAGISRAGFYFYFASKQALLASVIDRAAEQLTADIEAVLAPGRPQRPDEAVRATVRAAATLWWEHRAVQVAAFELGAAVDEVYRRTMHSFGVVAAPTVALLQRVGTVPEAQDEAAATRLVTALILMSERNFYDLMRGEPSAADRDALVDLLTRIWTRALGIAG